MKDVPAFHRVYAARQMQLPLVRANSHQLRMTIVIECISLALGTCFAMHQVSNVFAVDDAVPRYVSS